MQRRKFISYLSTLGMTLASPALRSNAQQARPDHLLICVNANGGWDPTMLMDPKGNSVRPDGRGATNHFSTSAVDVAGNIAYVSRTPKGIEVSEFVTAGAPAAFFPRHAGRLLVINGIDTKTNNHEAGSRFGWSGRTEIGYPSIAALLAASSAPQLPLSFITNGGYDHTASLLAAARIGGASGFDRLAFPNIGNPGDDSSRIQRYFPESVYARLEQARRDRIARQYAAATLPLQRRQILEMSAARTNHDGLKKLVQFMPEQASKGLRGQAEVAVAAFASGVAVGANLNLSGFDTHANHDIKQTEKLIELLDGIDHLWTLIERNALQDRVTVLVGSDFGRTPYYNNDGGKDHWNVTSMMALGAGIRGNRVLGQTNELFEAVPINAESLIPDPEGIVLTPGHLHKSLRQFLAVNAELQSRFSLAQPALRLFD